MARVMRIIDPSFEFIEDHLAMLTIPERIEHCGRICYKSEARISPGSAIPFCKKMVESGHGTTLEMAMVHLVVDEGLLPESKYVEISRFNDHQFVVSGSIRAFRESPGEYGSGIWNFLAAEFPLFFAESDPPRHDRVRFAEPHEIPDEHIHVAVKFIVNRAVTHELVRHRPCTFLQESQRYCRYDDDVVFIEPEWWDKSKRSIIASAEYDWESHMNTCECRYKELLFRGLKPQQARAVLPNSTKSEIIVYAALPEWKHIFNLRCSPAADPEMRRVMIPLREEFKQRWPYIF